GVMCERSGVIDLALEGKLLVGAFAAAVIGRAADSAYAGIAAGAAAGASVAALQVWLATRWRADQVIVGVGLNLAAAGTTSYLLEVLYDQAANSKPSPSFDSVATDPIVWIAIAAVIVVPLFVAHAPLGLRLRAAGDRPDALRAAGVSVTRTRWAAVAIGGAIVGVGGAELSLQIGSFYTEVSGGRGYIALVAIILAGWRPLPAAGCAAAFGLAEALKSQLKLHVAFIPTELIDQLPYVVTLAVLVIAPLRTRPPLALGRPED
ncbi:MAG TPA: ABC transporter permease, partial [Kofleriaceae bacterium]|nr:ABC transporter permease [Kofleriaceae bacterium]